MVQAFYFDGKSVISHPVWLCIDDNKLNIRGSGVALQIVLRQVNFGEPLLNAPRCIDLPDNGRCEVADEAALAHLLSVSGLSESLVVRLQKRWLWALTAFLLVLGGSAMAYFWGLPEAARFLAQQLPQRAVQNISNVALTELDQKYFIPSRLPGDRQDQIRARGVAFLSRTGTPSWRLHFRASRNLGSNAFALPSGDIILLDQLVLQLDEGEINAVLAHELGHVIHRHALRLIIQKTTIAITLAAWFGDVSSAAAGISSVLLQSGYSREAELEADAYAARLLLSCCQSAEPMISSLGKLERPRRNSSGLLNTHPDTRQRISAIRAMKP